MNSKLIKLLFGLCLFLLLILLIELNFSGSIDNQFSGLKSAGEDVQNSEIVLPVIELSQQAEESFSTIVKKPLFIKGRRPVKETVETVVNKEWGKADDFVLVGIYSIEDRVIALITGQKGNKEYLKKSEGDEISGWILSEIQSDRVLLESEGKQQSILLRKPRKPRKPQRSPAVNKAKPVIPKTKPAVPKKMNLNLEK